MAQQEIRDPIHGFVRFSKSELRVIQSPDFQRLRFISQLALTQFLYPSACHTRFEHSLGVCELASRIFDTVFHKDHFSPELADRLGVEPDPRCGPLAQGRNDLRLAALLHDVGHLPFSHAAEHFLLPSGQNHETMTGQLLLQGRLSSVLSDINVDPARVVKLAVGPNSASKFAMICEDQGLARHLLSFSPLEALLSEIITGEFGADRMDYLLRDSHHLGVNYGKFDHLRLVDCLRILNHPDSEAPTLGIKLGGLQAAEALFVARYALFSQVYYHPVRLALDHHLQEFFAQHRELFPQATTATLPELTEPEVFSQLRRLQRERAPLADRFFERQHYRQLFSVPLEFAAEAKVTLGPELQREFGDQVVEVSPKAKQIESFPVLHDGTVRLSGELSPLLRSFPSAGMYVGLVAPELRQSKPGPVLAFRKLVNDFLATKRAKGRPA